jgi:hypothetical protein
MLMADRDVSRRLSRLRDYAVEQVKPLPAPYPRYALFLSVSDGDKRAKVVTGTGADFDTAWTGAVTALSATMAADNLQGRWLRLDWAEEIQPMRWRDLRVFLACIKRSYFRYGIALDGKLDAVFLEQELNANAMLYGGNAVANATLNEKNFNLYARAKYPQLPATNFGDERELYVLSTGGAFVAESGEVLELNGSGPDGGRRKVEALSEDDVLGLISTSSSYLADQVLEDGRFIYGYHPCFDRRINAYNTLRHSSTTYSMIEAWDAFKANLFAR